MKTLLLVVAVLVAASGCKSPCRQLSERLCECQQSSFDRNTCLQRAATAESLANPTAAQNEACAALVPECDCRLVETPEGKKKCGFARLPDGCDADRPDGGSCP
ncbi:MAG: hypothetical protein INH41_02100 [Myxococcaceae bacterium]|jgi:hypothetical protein|nr:hypothetical protein [Myxococcaceae bacterium]MCA3011171.1 hypothetical protein [Myxococcaceae bacterium]